MQQTEEFLEMRVGVVGSRRGFRVVLHGEYRKFFVANAFHGSVVQIPVGNLEPAGAGHRITLSPDRESVVLRRYKYFPCKEIYHWMVAAPMSVGEFDRSTTESQTKQLVSQADAKGGEA